MKFSKRDGKPPKNRVVRLPAGDPVLAEPFTFFPGATNDQIDLSGGQWASEKDDGVTLYGDGIGWDDNVETLLPAEPDPTRSPAARPAVSPELAGLAAATPHEMSPEAAQIAASAVNRVNSAFGQVPHEFQADNFGSPLAAALTPPTPPQGSKPPSVYDPPQEAVADYQRKLAEYQQAQQAPQAPQAPQAQMLAQASPVPPMSERFGSDALAEAIRQQRMGDSLSRGISGLAGALTGGRAQVDLPASTALRDFLQQRESSVQDRNRRLLEARQAAEEGRSQQSHQAQMRLQGIQAEGAEMDQELQREYRDPESRASQLMRQELGMLAGELGIEGLAELTGGRSAHELQNDPELQRLLSIAENRDKERTRRLRSKWGLAYERSQGTIPRGFGGGGGGRGRRIANADDPVRQMYIDRAVEAGIADSPEQAANLWDGSAGDDVLRRRLYNQVATDDFSSVGTRQDERFERADAELLPPQGFRQVDPERRLTEKQAIEGAELVSVLHDTQANIRDYIQAAEAVTWRDIAQFNLGISTPAMRQAEAAQLAMQNYLRYLHQTGVPQRYELTMLERVNPKLNTIRGFISGADILRELERSLNRTAYTKLRDVYNMTPEGGRRGTTPAARPSPGSGASQAEESPSAPAPQSASSDRAITVTLEKDGQEREFTGTRDEVEDEIDKGWDLQ